MFIFVSSSCKFVMASVSCFLIFTSFGVDGFGVDGVDLSYLCCSIDNAGLMYVNCLPRWPNIKSTLTMCIITYMIKLY